MTPRPDLDVIDDLARLAGQAEPPALDDTAARRMIDAACKAPASVIPPRRSIAWPLATLTFAALAAFLWLSREQPAPAPAPAPSRPDVVRLTLPTGDRLVGSAGVKFELVEVAPASRRIALRSGDMVFDVAHAAPAQHFEVVTDQARVIATGTVFSVTTDGAVTRVHVFEGSVAIEHAGRRDALPVGASWSSDGAASSPAPITAAGESFARERAAKPAVAAAAPGESPPAPAVVDPAAPTEDPPPAPVEEPRAPPPVTAKPAAERAVAEVKVRVAEMGSEPFSEIPPRLAPAPAPATLSEARAAIESARYADALAKADSPLREGPSGSWDLVRGDALRALGRPGDAALAYESAARALLDNARLEAAYSAAYLRFHDLKDNDRALADLAGVDDPGTLFEERALVLRVEILMAAQRKNEAAVIAARYLDRFPRGSSNRVMRKLVP